MKYFPILISTLFLFSTSYSQSKDRDFVVIGYYAGRAARLDSFQVEKLTHIIFSFCHLKGNRLNVSRAADSATIRKMVSLKERNPRLKVLLSLGGWGGCETCSDVFADKKNREAFALSVKDLGDYFKTDGIDLDWEYPAIPGYPGHRYSPDDKQHFTGLVEELRKTLGSKQVISFAAGGFTSFLRNAIEWKEVMKTVDMVNLMTYDLVHGFSTSTGHHTPLYSTDQQIESTHRAIQFFDSIGVGRSKLVIGAAFYGRMWGNVEPANNGLYQAGQFKKGIPFRNFSTVVSPDSGYVYYRDSVAHAPYAYHPQRKEFVTFDDKESISEKTKYAIKNGLKGIMFWQLAEDAHENGLLEAIDRVIRLSF